MEEGKDLSGRWSLVFEWNEKKARLNKSKHGVDFEEARTAFNDPLLMTNADGLHSDDEPRSLSLGVSARGRLLVVVHAEDEGVIRLISCRKATRREREAYEEK